MIVIIDTGIGNFKSIQNMLARIGVASIVSADQDDVKRATKLILPGVGSFDKGVSALNKNNLFDAIRVKVLEEKTKILGICLGMQLLGEASEEGSLNGLALVPGKVKKFNFMNNLPVKKIPHMGWNYAVPKNDSILLSGFAAIPRFYFTHSYYFDCSNQTNVIATTPYGIEFCSALQHENIFGVQFHPEKSHRFGMQLLTNFIQC